MRKLSLTTILSGLLAAGVLTACNPKFDWRDYRSPDAPYAVLFPGKPATQTREINLDGQQVKMNMAAAEVDGITFAVGSTELADAEKAQAAITAMKTAMLKNLAASVTKEKSAAESGAKSIEIEAKGSRNGEAMVLLGRFVAKDKRAYQIIVVGREKHLVQDAVDTFMTSFKLN